LKKAQTLGYKITPQTGAYIYHKKAKIFDEYVDQVYKLKQTKDPVQRSLAKLLLNSLFGMFGYNATRVEKLNLVENDNYLDPKMEIAELIQRRAVSNGRFKTNVAIASAITSYARMFMYEYRKNAIYHDTDSVVLRTPLNKDLVSNTELGKFKLEREIKYGVFLGNKAYGLLGKQGAPKLVAAGLDTSSLTLSDMIESLKGTKKVVSPVVNFVANFKTLTVRRVVKDNTLCKGSESRLSVYARTVGGSLIKVGTLP